MAKDLHVSALQVFLIMTMHVGIMSKDVSKEKSGR